MTQPKFYTCTCVITENDDQRVAFVIDGREYSSPESYEQARRSAWHELNRRRVIAEFITEAVHPQDGPRTLPSWDDFRSTLDRRFPIPGQD
ncbi:hypothetical protein [Kineosporia babensis]|uniref:Uncharacterized protein n=1 Tax=Kineosporia babensis TaxID=499548 RepID=A0A9X1SRU6_9ACTN|nr:hypothetical protein [Kineosporia babensis]MCD5309987.1 hypothetical protein [Kineosporia babensis]